MKKTVNGSLAGKAFIFEQDAYVAIESFLHRSEQRLKSDPDKSEILADIEAAISEKLTVTSRTEVVQESVALQVLEQIGEVEAAGADDDEQKSTQTAVGGSWGDKLRSLLKHPIYKNKQDVVVDGVASGIARAVDIDPIWVRLAFVGLIFAGGSGIILYIVLSFLMSSELKGEQIKSASIANRAKLRSAVDKSSSAASRVASPIIRLVQLLVRVAAIGIFVGLIIGMIAIIAAAGYSLSWAMKAGSEAVNLGFSGLQGYIAIASLAVLILMPVLAIVTLLDRSFHKRPRRNFRFDWIMIFVWAASIFGLSISAPTVYSRGKTYIETKQPASGFVTIENWDGELTNLCISDQTNKCDTLKNIKRSTDCGGYWYVDGEQGAGSQWAFSIIDVDTGRQKCDVVKSVQNDLFGLSIVFASKDVVRLNTETKEQKAAYWLRSVQY
jgi:phage shock protein PspC (stress-responsive transcriptional regulator)